MTQKSIVRRIFQMGIWHLFTVHLMEQSFVSKPCIGKRVRGKFIISTTTFHLQYNDVSQKTFILMAFHQLKEIFLQPKQTNRFHAVLSASWLEFLKTDPWFGAFQIGASPFQYTDSSPLDYTNWVPGQPTLQCAQICHTTGTTGGVQCQQGKWRTADCEKASSQFICKKTYSESLKFGQKFALILILLCRLHFTDNNFN